MTDIWQERIASFIASKSVQVGLKDEADREGCLRLQEEWEFWEWCNYVYVLLQALSAWRKWDKCNKHQDSSGWLVIKVVMDETSSCLRYDHYEQLPPLVWLRDQTDRVSEFPTRGTWLKLRLWCINWWWQVLKITKHLNKQIRNKKKRFTLPRRYSGTKLERSDQHVASY